jgi:SmpA / OmlA family/Prokaryotic membrane lipoprotein lipid attachment site
MRRVIFAVVLALLLAACSKVTEENYAKIQNGMTEQEVYAILGSPTQESSRDLLGVSATSAKWVSGDKVVTVQFVGGKVVLRSFDKPANE